MSGGTLEAPGLGQAFARLVVSIILVLAVLLLAGGWYFADQVTARPTIRPFVPDTTVVEATATTIALETTADLLTGGRFGLQLPDGDYAALGSFVRRDGAQTTYDVVAYSGAVPAAGTDARVDEFWRVGTPAAVGIDHRDVAITGQLGEMAAWWVPTGDRGTVVYVHGRGSTREEALRFLPGIARAGWSTLVVTYRGDDGAPDYRDGRLRYGLEEYLDVQSGLQWVVDEVGRDRPLVLFGTSMGGAVVAQVLDRSDLQDVVDGVVLDSPLLSFDDTMDLQADLNGIPEFVEPALLPAAEFVAGLLYGLDTSALEQTDDDGTFDVPTLVFHGASDDFVPFGQSLRLAERVRRVEYVGYEGARHARSWNVDSERYEQRIATFLRGLS